MPKVKDRSALTKIDLKKRYELALKGLEDRTYDTSEGSTSTRPAEIQFRTP